MDELIQAMSIPELKDFKGKYEGNESVTKILDGYIEVKTREIAQAKAKADFERAIGKLIGKLPHPDDVHNIYMRWAKHEEAIPDSELEPVTIDGVEEMRQPTQEVWGWEVETNKGFSVGRLASATTTASKRAITVHKRVGMALEFVGNFRSASEACKHLDLIIGQDSAMRVLTNRNPYLADPYTGTDFTS